ncbi:hypothetical protein GGX14DRAFT_392809 [Mycena pura]|uniref:Uncharacterized protein n=1 Tax=Mycena pura TaxID=153505 RepID=A0AAD6VIS1_9AGAR|nr:hypothetical protein GGX14DRAFT_392809 [Mycena pura]
MKRNQRKLKRPSPLPMPLGPTSCKLGAMQVVDIVGVHVCRADDSTCLNHERYDNNTVITKRTRPPPSAPCGSPPAQDQAQLWSPTMATAMTAAARARVASTTLHARIAATHRGSGNADTANWVYCRSHTSLLSLSAVHVVRAASLSGARLVLGAARSAVVLSHLNASGPVSTLPTASDVFASAQHDKSSVAYIANRAQDYDDAPWPAVPCTFPPVFITHNHLLLRGGQISDAVSLGLLASTEPYLRNGLENGIIRRLVLSPPLPVLEWIMDKLQGAKDSQAVWEIFAELDDNCPPHLLPHKEYYSLVALFVQSDPMTKDSYTLYCNVPKSLAIINDRGQFERFEPDSGTRNPPWSQLYRIFSWEKAFTQGTPGILKLTSSPPVHGHTIDYWKLPRVKCHIILYIFMKRTNAELSSPSSLGTPTKSSPERRRTASGKLAPTSSCGHETLHNTTTICILCFTTVPISAKMSRGCGDCPEDQAGAETEPTGACDRPSVASEMTMGYEAVAETEATVWDPWVVSFGGTLAAGALLLGPAAEQVERVSYCVNLKTLEMQCIWSFVVIRHWKIHSYGCRRAPPGALDVAGALVHRKGWEAEGKWARTIAAVQGPQTATVQAVSGLQAEGKGHHNCADGGAVKMGESINLPSPSRESNPGSARH